MRRGFSIGRLTMRHHRIIIPFFAFVVIMTVSAVNGQCGDKDGARMTYGFKFGIFGSGTLNHKGPYSIAKGYELSTEQGISLGGFWDHSFLHNFDLGALLDLHQIRLQGEKEFLLELGLTLKANVDLAGNTIVLRPGTALSFGYLRKIAWLDNSNYISLNPFAEIIYFVNDKLGFLVEIGGHWFMSGGDVWSDVTGGPMLVLRAGIAH